MTHRKETELSKFQRTFDKQFELKLAYINANCPGYLKSFSSQQKDASLAFLIEMEENWWLEHIISELNTIQLTMAKVMLCDSFMQETKEQIPDQIQLLQRLVTEFQWLASYGVRLYY